jgi:hypothetical protein
MDILQVGCSFLDETTPLEIYAVPIPEEVGIRK